MLRFSRPNFRSGVTILKEPVPETDPVETKGYAFKPSDNGKDFAFLDETYMLGKYPTCLSTPPG